MSYKIMPVLLQGNRKLCEKAINIQWKGKITETHLATTMLLKVSKLVLDFSSWSTETQTVAILVDKVVRGDVKHRTLFFADGEVLELIKEIPCLNL